MNLNDINNPEPEEIPVTEPPIQDTYQSALQHELSMQRIRRDARRALEAEDRPKANKPEVLTLRERLLRPREPVRYRIDGWQPVGSRVVLAAQYKVGKTTATGNLVRSLVDGDPWLGTFTTMPVTGAVVILDLEMGAGQLDDWLAAQKIRNDDRVIPIPLRGNAGALDLLEPSRRAEWAAELASLKCNYLVLDCLRPVMDALGLDEHRDAGRFLVPFDSLLADAGINEAAVVHHMGHNGERSRGDSRIRDWPDVEWRYVRQDPEDPASPRFISAYGRDVEQMEAQLAYDWTTRHLTYVGGSRKGFQQTTATEWVKIQLRNRPGTSRSKLGEEAGKNGSPSRQAIYAAIDNCIENGVINQVENPNGSGKLLYLQEGSTRSAGGPPADPADGWSAALYRRTPADPVEQEFLPF